LSCQPLAGLMAAINKPLTPSALSLEHLAEPSLHGPPGTVRSDRGEAKILPSGGRFVRSLRCVDSGPTAGLG
jgi:hypothetical protein